MKKLPSHIRPSALPKLILCRHYRSESDAGNAAKRGTSMDTDFREQLEESAEEAPAEEHFPDEASVTAAEEKTAALVRGSLAGKKVQLDEEAQAAVDWAVQTAKIFAGDYPLESREEKLRTTAMGMSGTGDLLCVEGQWSADLKSGMKRNYMEQQAVYALGYMEDYFVEEWIVYLLYCDVPEVDTLRFTLEGAEKIVRDALDYALSDGPPELNEYCGWCARRHECPVRRESLGIIETAGQNPIRYEDYPSEVLREFVIRARDIEDEAKYVRKILGDRIAKEGEKIEGVSLTSREGSAIFPLNILQRYVKEIGTEKIFSILKAPSKSKVETIWAEMMQGKPFPEEHVIYGPGCSFPTIRRPKKAKSAPLQLSENQTH